MDDTLIEDEKKPFDSVAGGVEEETQPDPDEQIMLESGNGRVWLVKVSNIFPSLSSLLIMFRYPRFLMARWSAIDAEGIPLAKIRIYDNAADPSVPPRIFVHIPPDNGAPDDTPDTYEMDMVNQDVHNQIVVAEREKAPQSRARTTIMTGKVKHECNLRPRFSESYRARMRERTRVANTPVRQIRMIDDAVAGGRGSINRLSSGVTAAPGFTETVGRPKPVKGAFERMARMPRNQLLDMLFGLYRERTHWPIKLLRERTQQPEVYLKEVLSEIATLHRSGEHTGNWELKDVFKDNLDAKGEGVPVKMPDPGMAGEGDAMDEDDDEDDEDDDMEEVS